MAKIFGLDIPTGLEDLYYEIIMPLLTGTTGNIGTQGPQLSRAQKSNLVFRSLFVLWAPIYNALSSSRHAAWTAYWQTLPYGLHSGAGGWPGSGFSAFVKVNTPRYHAHLSLLLDPPMFDGGLVLNPQFINDLDHWEVSMPDRIIVADQQLNFLADDWDDGDPFYFNQNLPDLIVADYKVSFDAQIPLGGFPGMDGYATGLRVSLGLSDDGWTGNDETDNKHLFPYTDGTYQHYEIIFHTYIDDGWGDTDQNIYFVAVGAPSDIYWIDETSSYGGSPIIVDNISVIKQ